MKSLSAAEIDHLSARAGRIAHILVWISARNRSTGSIEQLGLWTGDDHEDVTVDGVPRLYYGAGGLLEVEPITHRVGLEVRMLQLGLAPMAPEVAMLMRGYDARLAPVEIHRALYDPAEPRTRIAPPRRVWKGWVDEVTFVDGADGKETAITLTVASNARAGTRGLTLKYSDESQKARLLPDNRPDRFFQYADISGATRVSWGS